MKTKQSAALTIKSDLVNRTIQILLGFEVDYNPSIKDKDFNDNGTWGKIVNPGQVVQTWTYNPNKHHNFKSDYDVMMDYVKRQLEVFKSFQPKQLANHIQETLRK